MERKITELEQKLLDDGWVLTEKHYTGNHSEKTEFYDYRKNVPYEKDLGFDAIVRIDSKRTKIINVGIPNVYIDNLTREKHEELVYRYRFLQDYVKKIVETKITETCKKPTLEDLNLTPKEIFIVKEIAKTDILEEIAKVPNLLALILIKTKDFSNIVRELVKAGVLSAEGY